MIYIVVVILLVLSVYTLGKHNAAIDRLQSQVDELASSCSVDRVP